MAATTSGIVGGDFGGEAGDDVAVAVDEEFSKFQRMPGSGLVVAPL